MISMLSETVMMWVWLNVDMMVHVRMLQVNVHYTCCTEEVMYGHILKICLASKHCSLKKSRHLSLNIIKHIIKLPNSNQSISPTDWLKPYQTVVPWYTNPAPWQIFRLPWVALSTAARTAGVFPLREYGISFYLFAYLICKTPNVAV